MLPEEAKPREEVQHHMQMGSTEAEAIAKDVEELLASRREQVQAAERDRLSEAAGDQENLSDEIEQIGRRLGALSEQTPLLNPAIEDRAMESPKPPVPE